MNIRNEKGMTLVEILAALTISFVVIGLASSVFFQTFRNVDISDSHISLRQEANIIISTLSKSHEQDSDYPITYVKEASGEWVLTIGHHKIHSELYDVQLTIHNKNSNNIARSFEINTFDSSPRNDSFQVNIKEALEVVSLKLINKTDSSKTFELKTVITRL